MEKRKLRHRIFKYRGEGKAAVQPTLVLDQAVLLHTAPLSPYILWETKGQPQWVQVWLDMLAACLLGEC